MKNAIFALLLTLVCSGNLFAQKGEPVYSSKKSYSAKEKSRLMNFSGPVVVPNPKPNFYLDCKEDVAKFCPPFRSEDSGASLCLETKFMFRNASVSDKCFAALKFTRHWLKTSASRGPIRYSEGKEFSMEDKIRLMQFAEPFVAPEPKPNYKLDCAEDEKKLCPTQPPGSTDSSLCVREKFFQGAVISDRCFPALRYFSRWIESTMTSYPQCIADYNQYCRNESTGIGVSDCMMNNIGKLTPSCAATIRSLRPSVEKDREARAKAAAAATQKINPTPPPSAPEKKGN
ncbi:MAG: hypothetical protein HUU57_04620 [Bdellovibrio sp.]|nr:hypothetical protein [Bdellovibrio sp.]